MSLAGGSSSNFGCSSVDSGVLCSGSNAPSSGMPNVVDRHCMQRNSDLSAQKWSKGFEKAPNNGNGNGAGKVFESDGNAGLPKPSVVLYDRKLDFSVCSNRTIGCGFVNLGNTCFLSSTLQCLCHLPPWFNYIISDHHLSTCKMNRSECIVCMLQRLVRNAVRHHDSSFAPREIVDKLKQICSHMQRGRQEDAHEFMLSLLNGMQSSLLHGLQRLDSYSQETTVLCQIFGGYLQSRIICRYCHCASSTYEHFFNISLDIKNAKSLGEALTLFTKSEVMDGENAYKCDRCRRLTPADKMYSVYKAPNILIIHLKRYSLEEKGHSKLSHHIFFTDTLDLSQFMSVATPKFSHLYHLQCVLVHVGASINSGHYFAYVCGVNNKWFEMNDERVREVPFHDVKSAQAYMLFFVRKSNEPPQKPYSNSCQYISDKACSSSSSSKTYQPIQGRGKFESTNGVSLLNGSSQQSSTFVGSGINQKSTFDPRNVAAGDPSQRNPTNAGKLPSSDFNRGRHPPVNGSGVRTLPFENGSRVAVYANGSGMENSRENKNFAGVKSGVSSSSSSSVSGFIPLHGHNNGSKLSSSVHRDKVIFKIIRPKDRCNGPSNISKSTASATISRAPSISPGAITTALTPQNSVTKLVAYDDESSDQESDIVAEDQKVPLDQSTVPVPIGSETCVLASGDSEAILNVPSPCAAAAHDDVPELRDPAPAVKYETGRDRRYSLADHGRVSHRSLDLEAVVEAKSKFNPLPKLKRSSSDSMLRSQLQPETVSALLQSSKNVRVSAVGEPLLHNNTGDTSVEIEAKFCAGPLYNEHNECVAGGITDSKRHDSFAVRVVDDVDAAAAVDKPNAPTDSSGNNVDRVVATLDTAEQTDRKLRENVLEISAVDELMSLPSDKPPGDSGNKGDDAKSIDRRRHGSRDDSASSRHKRRKLRHGKDRSSGDNSDENVYIWVERTLETIQKEKSGDLPARRNKSDADEDVIEKHSSKNGRDLSIVRLSDKRGQGDSRREFRPRLSSSYSEIGGSSIRARSRSNGRNRNTDSVELNYGKHRSRSRSSCKNFYPDGRDCRRLRKDGH